MMYNQTKLELVITIISIKRVDFYMIDLTNTYEEYNSFMEECDFLTEFEFNLLKEWFNEIKSKTR